MGAVADRVKETSTTTGTGTVTLAGAVAQFQTFNASYDKKKNFYYVIVDGNGTGWETGTGYLSGSTSLVRDIVHASTNSNNAISLSANTHTVFSTITADQFEDLQGKIYASARGFNMP